MKYEEYLMHFNPNHDKFGRFSKSSGGAGAYNTSSTSNAEKESASSNKDKAKIALKKLKEAVHDGHVRVDDTMNNMRNMQYMQIINDQQITNQQIQNQLLVQQSIQEANRCASLSMTMGMNPFMFG